MLKFIVVDARKNFLDDIRTRLLLDDERNIDVVSELSSADNLHNAINAYKPDIVAICENIVETQEDWNYADVTIVGYALTEYGTSLFGKFGLPCYGIVRNTAHLLNLMEGPIPKSETSEMAKTAQQPVANTPVTENAPEKISEKREDNEDNKGHVATTLEYRDTTASPDENDTLTETIESAPKQNIRDEYNKQPQYVQTRKSQIEQLHERKKIILQEDAAQEKLNADLIRKKKPAQVVTVYSSKGGVGKTTLSTEIASYLALTEHGRGRYQVCIADYNIDFGDVRATLGLQNDGPDMTIWAMDIRERIQNGEAPENIQYTKSEIGEYLQEVDKIGLYALCAPNTHEESMDIGQNELAVMLRNLVQNGGFDFVVCDTGNNTRDSSFCALEMADHIFLVVTQDVNAASCNKSVLETFEAIDFDMSKIRLVINKIMPVKYTGVQTKDLEDYFDKFPCVARIKNDMDIVKTNNLSQPIVLQPNHDVTKELQKIVAFLTQDDGASAIPVKRGFLSWLKRR